MVVLTEKQVMRVFNKYKKQMISVLGNKVTIDSQLTTVGKHLFGPLYVGTFSQSYKPKAKPSKQMFIINVDTKGMPGTHWVAVFKNGKTYYMYDSFGRRSHRLLPVFSGGRLVIDSDRDAEQHPSTDICGPLWLAWLSTVKDLGIRNALKV